jgi:hypothetical protein
MDAAAVAGARAMKHPRTPATPPPPETADTGMPGVPVDKDGKPNMQEGFGIRPRCGPSHSKRILSEGF